MTRAGVYIHIPFCRSRCSYCDFATGPYESALAERYVDALVVEFDAFCLPEGAAGEADTIYFGGGTPSLLEPEQLARVLAAVRNRFRVSADAEITLEMNPGTISPARLAAFRRAGINRASFGVQTFDDGELRRLGRTHTAADARQTLHDLIAAGFTNISFDLIAGLPEQTRAGWSRNLDEALALAPAHLSLYLLEVHAETPLAEQIRRGMWRAPDADLAAEMYEMMVARAREAGYVQYEISNFCRRGFESRHNVKYWTGAPYYGFGCAAHSFDGHSRRWSNERDVRRYVALVEERRGAVADATTLDARAAGAEALFLGLRLLERGVDLREHRVRFGADVRTEHRDDLQRFGEAGLIELCGDVLRLTPAGALLSNEVFAALI